MVAWSRHMLGDLLEIKHGFAFKGEFFSDSGDHVLLTPGNFRETGGLKPKGEKEKFYRGEFPEDYLLRRGDMVVAMTDLVQDAPILGSPAFVPDDNRFLHNQRLGKIINLKTNKIVPEFLFYLLNTASVRAQIKGSASGATVRHTSPSRIYQVAVRLPSLPTQRRIAGILLAYDELIENSQRRIQILETMARALYREWFVHFRFPGHENVPRVDSPIGDLPEGWEVRSLSYLCSRMESGGTPRRNRPEYWTGGEISWFKTGELWDGFVFDSEEKITEQARRESTARVFESGTILMAIYGSPTVGRLGILTKPSSCNQAALGLVADSSRVSQTFLYFVLFFLRDEFNGMAQGAAQQNISKEKVAGTMATVPPRVLVERFDSIAQPIMEQIQGLQHQVSTLRRTRDLLLPRLLSGQVDLLASA